MAKKKKAKAKTLHRRTWQIQTEPAEALPALCLRYLTPKKTTSFNVLFGRVWDDLCECMFWTRTEVERSAKVFYHGLGMARMDRRRQVVREDMQSALVALMQDGVIGQTAQSFRLVSVEERARWLAARPPELLRLYRTLRMAHDFPNWEEVIAGLDTFNTDGTLKDPRDEEIRQLKLENAQLKVSLEETRAILKLKAEADRKRKELRREARCPTT